MRLTQDQVGIIKGIIENSEITIRTLREDVLDHLCCVVEHKMIDGNSFEQSMNEAIDELAPGGLARIQNETIYLLNSTKIIAMKKLMYASGLLCSMAIVSGWVFKLLHLPGGTELNIYGFFGLVFIVVPLVAIDRYKISLRRSLSERLKYIFGVTSALLIAVSMTFKLLHLEGTLTLFAIGSTVFVLGFLPFLFFTMYKKSAL